MLVSKEYLLEKCFPHVIINDIVTNRAVVFLVRLFLSLVRTLPTWSVP